MTTRLEDLQVLLIDCQTTGSQPDKGHLLEIGWAVTSAGRLVNAADVKVDSHLLALPGRTEIPRSVERLTGIYVDDLIRAIRLAAKSNRVGGGVFQIATSAETTVGELVQKLLPILSGAGINKVRVAHAKPRLGDIRRNFADTSKARKALGWQARVPLKQGLARTVDWFLKINQ